VNKEKEQAEIYLQVNIGHCGDCAYASSNRQTEDGRHITECKLLGNVENTDNPLDTCPYTVWTFC